jgi:Tfp pilus assembly protein PilO
MKAASKKTTNLVIGAMLAIAAISFAFWVFVLGPKRDEVTKLDGRIVTLESSLAQHRSEVEAAEQARESFAADYEQLVVLGKAIPSGDETASLLVQLNEIAGDAGVRFETFTQSGEGGGEGEASAAPVGEAATPTEATASLLPLGASVGPAGLAVMPYTLTLEGDFFTIADFIKGLDRLVKTTNANVAVDGRLITVGGFSLAPAAEGGFPRLDASFSLTTYLTPPGQGMTPGATASGPEGDLTLASSTTTAVAP